MVLFVLSCLLPFTGLSAISALTRVSSSIGLGVMGFENWKLKKLQKLGISELMINPIFTEEEEALREFVRSMRINKGQSPILDDEFKPIVIDFEHEDEDIAGRYAFICQDEFNAFCDSVRHYNLSVGEGPEVDRLGKVLDGSGVEIHQLSFLWRDFDPVFKKARKVSAIRLNDREFLKMAGMTL